MDRWTAFHPSESGLARRQRLWVGTGFRRHPAVILLPEDGIGAVELHLRDGKAGGDKSIVCKGDGAAGLSCLPSRHGQLVGLQMASAVGDCLGN